MTLQSINISPRKQYAKKAVGHKVRIAIYVNANNDLNIFVNATPLLRKQQNQIKQKPNHKEEGKKRH
jgi:hypothetical protein